MKSTLEHVLSLPYKSESASDAIFYGVVHGLEAQRFVPGQRLVESDLASQFGVGRNSVREAIQRLAADGIVDKATSFL
jgi:DNA-binding GntR family transcriptional regulator